jgi:hypothetical protein
MVRCSPFRSARFGSQVLPFSISVYSILQHSYESTPAVMMSPCIGHTVAMVEQTFVRGELPCDVSVVVGAEGSNRRASELFLEIEELT